MITGHPRAPIVSDVVSFDQFRRLGRGGGRGLALIVGHRGRECTPPAAVDHPASAKLSLLPPMLDAAERPRGLGIGSGTLLQQPRTHRAQGPHSPARSRVQRGGGKGVSRDETFSSLRGEACAFEEASRSLEEEESEAMNVIAAEWEGGGALMRGDGSRRGARFAALPIQ